MDQELIELRDEEADSEDGPITNEALKIADEVLSYRPDFRPSIAPDSDGGIRMEWFRDQKIMRVAIRSNGLNCYIYTRQPDQESGEVHPLQKTKCMDYLAWLKPETQSNEASR